MRRLSSVNKAEDVLNRCDQAPCVAENASAEKHAADSAMSVISNIRGIALKAFPDVAFVRVKLGGDPADDLTYTMIRDKAYKNVSSFLKNQDETLRDYEDDHITVVDWIEGTYPNFFFSVDIEDIDLFARRYAGLQARGDYEKFVSEYGVRRTNPGFWAQADWFQDQYLREEPITAGLLDLNRYQNR